MTSGGEVSYPAPRLIPLAEAASRLGVEPKRVARWVSDSTLEGYFAGTTLQYVDGAQIDALRQWLSAASPMRPPPPPPPVPVQPDVDELRATVDRLTAENQKMTLELAGAAKRDARLEETEHQLEHAHARLELSLAKLRESKEEIGRLTAAAESAAGMEAELAGTRARLGSLIKEQETTRHELDDLRGRLASAQTDAQAARDELALAKPWADHATVLQGELNATIERERVLTVKLSQVEARLDAALAEQQASISAIARITAAAQLVPHLEAELRDARARLDSSVAAHEAVKAELAETQTRLEAALRDGRLAGAEVARISPLVDRAAALEAELAQLRERFAATTGEHNQALQRLKELESASSEIRTPEPPSGRILALETEIADLRARLEDARAKEQVRVDEPASDPDETNAHAVEVAELRALLEDARADNRAHQERLSKTEEALAQTAELARQRDELIATLTGVSREQGTMRAELDRMRDRAFGLEQELSRLRGPDKRPRSRRRTR